MNVGNNDSFAHIHVLDGYDQHHEDPRDQQSGAVFSDEQQEEVIDATASAHRQQQPRPRPLQTTTSPSVSFANNSPTTRKKKKKNKQQKTNKNPPPQQQEPKEILWAGSGTPEATTVTTLPPPEAPSWFGGGARTPNSLPESPFLPTNHDDTHPVSPLFPALPIHNNNNNNNNNEEDVEDDEYYHNDPFMTQSTMAGDEGEDGAVIRESFSKDYYANSSDDEAALLDEDDSPDAIGIRRGTAALRILRLVALTLFVAVSAVASFQVHRYVNDVHTEQFEEYWHDQADHWMHNVFWPDLALKYQVAQSTATSLSHWWHWIVTQQQEPQQQAPSFNDTILLGLDMLRTQRLASAAVQVAWSPWIATE